MPTKTDDEIHERMAKPIPMIPGPQVVPSAICFQCEVCCRFPEQDSFLRPYFTEVEIQRAVSHGVTPSSFPDHRGSQVQVVPHPTGDGFLCPAFDPATHHCGIYEVRPLDCQLYPFALMWNEHHDAVLLGWDPLCPFLLDQALGQTPLQQEEPLNSTLELPKPLVDLARAVGTYLETGDILNTLAVHSRLITPFQPEVVVVQRLERLTALLRSTGTVDTR